MSSWKGSRVRFLIREQEYEVPLAGGRFEYPATGAVETWRLTAAEEFRVLRVDLDARSAEPATSTLFHVLLTSDWQPERLTYRQFGAEGSFGGTVIVQGGRFLHSRDAPAVGPAGDIEEVDFGLVGELPRLWFPSALGRCLAVAGKDVPDAGQAVNSAALLPAEGGRGFTLAWHTLRLTTLAREEIVVGRRRLPAAPISVEGGTGRWTIWLDSWRLPLRVDVSGEVVAAETHNIRYEANLKRHPALEVEDQA
jgi:hypothetical protein